MADRRVSAGIHVPAVSSSSLPSGAAYADFFRRVEELGLDSIWVEDRIFHRSSMLEGPGLLFWAAANTSRVRLGSAVLLLNIRNAALVARQASTLAHLSGGRLTLGVSLGGQPGEYEAVGISMKRRVSVFEQSILDLRALLRGDSLTVPGDEAQLNGSFVRPEASIPIHFGGRVPAVLERAGRLADGWIMGPFGGLTEFKHSWQIVQDSAISAGRDPGSLEAGRLIYVAIDQDRTRAKARLSRYLHQYYNPALDIDEITSYGPAEKVASQLREFADAGMSNFMLGVPSLDPEELACIGEEIAPILRGER